MIAQTADTRIMPGWRLERNHLQDLRLLSGMLLPLLAGLALFGWRAAGTVGLVMLGAIIARHFLSRIRTWATPLSPLSLCVRSALVAMFLPATLFDIDQTMLTRAAHWPLPIAIGMLLALLTWLLGRWGTIRFSAIVITTLAGMFLATELSMNDRVLQRDHLIRGDLLDGRFANRPASTAETWLNEPTIRSTVVLLTNPAAEQLNDFLECRFEPDRRTMTIPRLIGDTLPPMEDLVIGGHPTPIGYGSALAVMIGGLLLVYRRMAAFRVPAIMIIVTLATLIIAPVPVLISPEETAHRWLAGHDPRVGWAGGITFANYLLIASPALIVALFLACQPGIRPTSLRAAVRYAFIYGVLCGLGILFISVDYGPLLALIVAQFFAPTLDHWYLGRARCSV